MNGLAVTDAHSPDQTAPWPQPRGYTPQDHELVVTLWDYARTARLSELYYGRSVARLGRINFWMELAIAGAVSGSGISGLDVWKNGAVASAWPWLAACAAFLAIAKPLLALDRRLRHGTQQQQTYRRLIGTCETLVFDIQQAGTLSLEHRQRFQRARDILRQAEEQDDGAVAPSALRPLQERVKEEMPADKLWVPKVSAAGALA